MSERVGERERERERVGEREIHEDGFGFENDDLK